MLGIEQEYKPQNQNMRKQFEALLERLFKGSIGRLSISAINEQMLSEKAHCLLEIAVRPSQPPLSMAG